MSPRSRPIVAIDGPAGAGKSTVARCAADQLAYVLVDTGAMYRAVALASQRMNVPWSDGEAVGRVASDLVATAALKFERDDQLGVRVKWSGEDISEAIRMPDIGMGASLVSSHAPVRDALLGLQRQAGAQGGVVLEGRDIGTVVFPDAEFKFFLTARPEIRAERRFKELQSKGQAVTLEQTLSDVLRRDEQDTMRTHAPLRPADSAITIDCSELDIDATVQIVVDTVRKR